MKTALSIIAGVCAWLGISPDAMAQWSVTQAPIANWLGVASSANGSNLVAAYDYDLNLNGGIWVSTNRGATWAQTSASITNTWTGVASSSNGMKLIAVSSGVAGAIYASTNAGTNWNPTLAGNDDYNCVASSPDGTKIVAGAYISSTPIHYSTNSGVNWIAPTGPPEYQNAVAISADGSKAMAASGAFGLSNTPTGAIYYCTNSGQSWFRSDAPTNLIWWGIACSSNGSIGVAVAQTVTNGATEQNSGAVYISTNYGAHWAPTGVPALVWFCAACSADGSHMTIGAQAINGSGVNAVYSTTNSGSNWFINDTIQGQSYSLGLYAVTCSADGSKLAGLAGYVYVNPELPGSTSTPPNLRATFVQPGSVVLSWPDTGSYTLQQNTNIAATNWAASSYTVTTNGGTNSVTITSPIGRLFFRLSNP